MPSTTLSTNDFYLGQETEFIWRHETVFWELNEDNQGTLLVEYLAWNFYHLSQAKT